MKQIAHYNCDLEERCSSSSKTNCWRWLWPV